MMALQNDLDARIRFAREEEACVSGSFSGEALDGGDLTGMDFRDAVFSGCRFTGCDFSQASFVDVRFEQCSFVGCRFLHITVSSPLLFPLGLTCRHFSSLDYFPLLPFAGWFIWGIVLGRLLYASGKTRLPGHGRALPLRALRAIGRHSLPLYLLHQPVFFLLLTLYSRLIA